MNLWSMFQPPQQCEQPEMGSIAQGLSHTLFTEFNSSWAAKTSYQSCGSVSWGECTLATNPESYQPAPAARLQPGQGTGTGSRAGHMAEPIWALGDWDYQCTCTPQVLLRNFIVQFLALAVQGWDAVKTTSCRVLWPLYFLQSWEDQIDKWQIK